MEYFRILNLKKEPFSNSPEPDFFYSSIQHRSCLQQLELAIRLHRGLNVVIGEVGTGKTTICRQLILKFAHQEEGEESIRAHLLMDPAFSTPLEFLNLVATSLGLAIDKADASEWQIKENIKHYLFENCVDGGQIVVLIIDEGQKLPDFCLEILREFLNYETNEHKLLQIVIFAQKEFQDIIRKYPNFQDRVNQFYFLEPLSFQETKKMIEYRIAKASDYDQTPKLFTLSGLWGVYHYTGGYPRKIITLCHQVMLALIIQNKSKADWFLIRSCARRVSTEKAPSLAYRYAFIILGILIFISSGFWIYNGGNADVGLKSSETAVLAAKAETRVAVVQPMPEAEKKMVSGDGISLVKDRPEILGVLKVERGNAVYRFLGEIYGNYDRTLVDAFRKLNPHIMNINVVLQGDSVKMPAVAARENPLGANGCRVQLSAKSTLNDALKYIRLYPQDLPPVRLFPYWNKKEGLIFAVLMLKNYESGEEASSVIEGAASPYLKTGKVICKWEEGTEFYGR
jgi:general secretion pathway protein A